MDIWRGSVDVPSLGNTIQTLDGTRCLLPRALEDRDLTSSGGTRPEYIDSPRCSLAIPLDRQPPQNTLLGLETLISSLPAAFKSSLLPRRWPAAASDYHLS